METLGKVSYTHQSEREEYEDSKERRQESLREEMKLQGSDAKELTNLSEIKEKTRKL